MTPEQQALSDKLTNLQRLTVLGVDFRSLKSPLVQSELSKLLWDEQKVDFDFPDYMRMAFLMGAGMGIDMARQIVELEANSDGVNT